MKNMSSMFMNTKSAFATTNAGYSCAQMPCASEAEYIMLCVGAAAVVSTFVLPVAVRVSVGVIVAVLLALRLWAVHKTK
ncbi:MAG: hypothetical protein E7450_00600 [Ruminococcaceae bacterium]|nr:hypothetical protein [Oscillospiraceae bacterium]